MNDATAEATVGAVVEADGEAKVAADAAAEAAAVVDRFLALLAVCLADGTLTRLVLARHHGEPADLQRIDGRLIALRGAPTLSVVWHHTTRDVTRNFAVDAAAAELKPLLGSGGFRHARLDSAAGSADLRIGKRGRAVLQRSAVAQPGLPLAAATESSNVDALPAHDRPRQGRIDPARPWLHALGVTDAQHCVVPAMARKWRQINKFVEVFDGALASAGMAAAATLAGARADADAAPLHVVDFGSGKGYLTFAVHDHPRHALGRPARVTGVELRRDLVALGNAVAARLASDGVSDGLAFERGDVRDDAARRIDVMIALHACDTATDHAIHLGIRAGAAVLICSPCCHAQVRPQLLSPHPLWPVLQHGIHLGQEAEMVTDSLRALLLEACGYTTQVFEFVTLEHTRKNKMILAVRAAGDRSARAAEAAREVAEVKRFYGIREQALETLLRADGRLVG